MHGRSAESRIPASYLYEAYSLVGATTRYMGPRFQPSRLSATFGNTKLEYPYNSKCLQFCSLLRFAHNSSSFGPLVFFFCLSVFPSSTEPEALSNGISSDAAHSIMAASVANPSSSFKMRGPVHILLSSKVLLPIACFQVVLASDECLAEAALRLELNR